MGVCYIVGAGSFSGMPTPKTDDFVIAADGGYDHLRKIGIIPDLIIGDLDSIEMAPDNIETERHPVMKDETDMHLAYLEGAARGYTEFHIYGGTGGRADHTYANYCLLLYIRRNGHRAYLYGDTGIAQVIKNEKITVSGGMLKHFSAFAIGGTAVGVSIKGLEYECEGARLTPYFPLAVSNRFIGGVGTVEVLRGALLLIIEA